MDLAGIEPASESLSPGASPITAVYLNSLGRAANSSLTASVASSYARRLKALPVSFPAIMTPVYRARRCVRADEWHQATANNCSLSVKFRFSGYNAVRPADGFSDFKTPVETSTSPG